MYILYINAAPHCSHPPLPWRACRPPYSVARLLPRAYAPADISDTHPIIGLLAVSAIVGGILLFLWVLFLQRNARSMIMCTLWTSVVLELVCAVSVMFISVGAGVVFFFLAAITLWYVRRHNAHRHTHMHVLYLAPRARCIGLPC